MKGKGLEVTYGVIWQINLLLYIFLLQKQDNVVSVLSRSNICMKWLTVIYAAIYKRIRRLTA